MRRVERYPRRRARPREPRDEAALRAVAVQHVDTQLGCHAPHLMRRGPVPKPEEAGNRQGVNPEGGPLAEAAQSLFGQRVGVEAVGHDADLVPARRQLMRQVVDVTEQPSDGCAEDLQDTQRPGRQSHRSEITSVSPGKIGKSSPTTPLTISLPWRR